MEAYKLPIHLRKYHLKKLEEVLKKENKSKQQSTGPKGSVKVPKIAMTPRNIKGKSR